MEFKKIIFDEQKNVFMRCYLQECGGEFSYIKARPAMIVLPGGGYGMCSEREADPVALAYAKVGFQTFILNYTLKSVDRWPAPLNDYDRAVEYIRDHAEELGVDVTKISCVGFSAGGHLAAMAATSAKNKPVAAVLCYPGLQCMSYVPDACKTVNPETSPCFIVGTRDDMISPKETLEFAMRLTDYDIRYEYHMYSFGPHGASTGEHFTQPVETHITERFANWVEDSIGFIKELIGDFGENGMTKPLTTAYINANHEPFYSLDCTIGHLAKNEETRFAVAPIAEALNALFPPEKSEEDNGTAFGFLDSITATVAYRMLKMTDEVIDGVNARLKAIKK